jgi:hypothetical protein
MSIYRNLVLMFVLSQYSGIVQAWNLSVPTLDVPLSVISKNSIFGKGKVLVITNTSDEYLHECSVSINPPNENPKIIPTISPHASENIGWLELGFEIRPADLISILCKKYSTPFTLKIK